MELGELLVSENLRREIESNPRLEIVGEPRPLEFQGDGSLVEMLSGSREQVLAPH
jgi:hypothetical protein